MKKVTINIPTLNSHLVVARQVKMYLTKLNVYKDQIDITIVDDGSKPSLVSYLHDCGFAFEKRQESHNNLDVWSLDNINIIETQNYNDWTQAIACNIAVRFAESEYVYNTAIDHIATENNIQEVLAFTGDCLKFPRRYGVLNDNGVLDTSSQTLEEYGHRGDTPSIAWDIYSMKRDLFLSINGYDETKFGHYWAVDLDFFSRFEGTGCGVQLAQNNVYVFPDPSSSKLFHSLKR